MQIKILWWDKQACLLKLGHVSCHVISHLEQDRLQAIRPNRDDHSLHAVSLSAPSVSDAYGVRCSIPHNQGQTGTRYPTRTRSFFQYPICTRFVFKIIGYFGYRVFQKTMFFKWKTALGSYKILTNIFLYHLHLTKLDWLLPQCIVG